jgi:predicted enzyme related to lactoylglutathione lyase
MEPFDVMGQGIMGIVADPAGAVFGIWQPQQHRGVELRDAPFSVVWVDSMSRDLEKAKPFYSAVFGWEVKRSPFPGGGDYWLLEKNGKQVGGLFGPMPGIPDQVPSYWQIHFGVRDADDICRRAAELGGTVTFGPQDMDTVGRIASITDPQGAMFGVLQPPPGR